MKFDFRNLYEIDHEEIFRDIDFSVVFQLVLDGVIVGIVAGFFAASFRYSLSFFERLRLDFMSQTDFMSIGMWMVGVVLMGYFVYRLLKWEPISGGSGIPQIEGEMQGIFNMNAARTLIAKYIGGSLTSLGGFSVGREGPSIQVGGAAGKLIAKILRRPLRQERVLTSAGAAAGLAAAFNAPISGAIFVFEEVHKSFYPVLVIPTFTAALVSNFIASLVFGLGPSLGFTVQHVVPIDYIPYLVLIELTCEAIWSWTYVCWKIFNHSFNFITCDCLFIFSNSSWFNLGRLYFSKNFSISSRLSILLAYSRLQ